MKLFTYLAAGVIGLNFYAAAQDTTPPVIDCPANITVNNTFGQCGAVVNFSASATDDQTTVSGNLLVNGDAETGTMGNWTVVNGGDGWAITTADAHSGTSAFIGSYSMGTMSQTIDLVSLGYSAGELDGSPEIAVSEWYKASSCCSAEDNYFYLAELLNSSMTVIASYNLGTQSVTVPSTATWQEVSHTFTGYPTGVRYIRITHGSSDDEFWAGQYGTVIDDSEVIITASNVTVTYAPNTGTMFPVGTTTVTATAEDGSGNLASCTFDVTVNDVSPPLPSAVSLPTLTGDCEVTVINTPTSNDNCDGPIAGTTSSPLYYDTQGTYSITWTYTDSQGNSSTQQQTVIVDDVTPPVPDQSSLPDLTATCEQGAPLIVPTATDGCSGAVMATTATTFPITSSTTIVWSFMDAEGNESTQNQLVTITGVDVSTAVSGLTITANNSGATSYQWMDCTTDQPIAGETTASYTATSNGSYAVIVTDDGCTDTSACVTIADVGLTDLATSVLSIYPNPSSSGYFNIVSNSELQKVTVRDLTGKELEVSRNGNVLNATHLRNGKYFVELTTSSGTVVKPILLIR